MSVLMLVVSAGCLAVIVFYVRVLVAWGRDERRSVQGFVVEEKRYERPAIRDDHNPDIRGDRCVRSRVRVAPLR